MSNFINVFKEGFMKLSEDFRSIPENFSSIVTDPITIFALIGVLVLILAIIKMRKIQFTTKTLTMVAIAVALTTVLKMFKIFQMPNGGSVTFGSMIPILLLALVYGTETGLLAGFIYGIIDFILGPWIVHPVQVLFDYPLPFMMLGLAGMFRQGTTLNIYSSKIFGKLSLTKNIDPTRLNAILGILVAIFFRFICHFISGVVFFASSAPEGMSPYLYSFGYNAGFLSIEFLICIVVMSFIPLKRLMKSMVTNSTI